MYKKLVCILVMTMLIVTAVSVIGISHENNYLIDYQKINPINKKGETTVTLNPTDDSYVAEGNPDTNYGFATSLFIQSYTEEFKNVRTYLKFDLSSIPDDAFITGATLRLYCWSALYASVDADLYGIYEQFEEGTITWNNQPWNQEYDPFLTSRYMSINDSDRWCEWSDDNLKDYIQSGILLDDLGLMIKTEPENVSGQYGFNSKEWDEDIGELVVTYLDPPMPNLDINVKGGFRGYIVTVSNIGNETASGNFSMYINTYAPFMFKGGELDILPTPIPSPGESMEFNMKPVFGFGSAFIDVLCILQIDDFLIFYYGEDDGFVFLSHVSAEVSPNFICYDILNNGEE